MSLKTGHEAQLQRTSAQRPSDHLELRVDHLLYGGVDHAFLRMKPDAPAAGASCMAQVTKLK
eukprot:5498526-Amphidinium_carterae.1